MPTKVYCPECDEPIRPRPSEAVTKIDCPECGALVRVPKAPSGKADRDADGGDRPRSRQSDDRDDRRRRARKKGGKKKAKSNRRLLIGLLAGAAALLFVVVLVGGYVAYRMSLPDPDKTLAGEDWYKADEPGGLFTAYFPGDKPKYEKFAFQPPAFLAKKAGQRADELGFGSQSWERRHDGRQYTIALMTLPGSNSGTEAEQIAANTRTPPGPGVTVLHDDQVAVGTRQARRLVTRAGSKGQASLVIGVGGRQVLAVVVSGDASVSHDDPLVKAFFDNFAFHK